MKRFRKLALLLVMMLVVLLVGSACGSGNNKKNNSGDNNNSNNNNQNNENEDMTPENYAVAVLKGPTAVGFVKAWDDSDNGTTKNKYNVTAYGTADEITIGLVKGDIDIAAVPCNLASVLYNKTQGKIQVAAINTLGVLYVVSDGDNMSEIKELKGKTIYTTGKGTTPEYILNYILRQNGLEPGKDVTIEYKSEATEVVAMMSANKGSIGMLPQPYVTTVLSKNTDMKIIFNMTEEWNKVSNGKEMVTGVVVARKEVVEKNPLAFDEFMKDYKASTEYVNTNISDAAELVEKHDLFKAAVAEKAIPDCNIKFIQGDDMKNYVENYLSILFEANAQSIGGTMPGEDFYLK